MDMMKLIRALDRTELHRLKKAIAGHEELEVRIRRDFDFSSLEPGALRLIVDGEKLKFCRLICEQGPVSRGVDFALRLWDICGEIVGDKDDKWMISSSGEIVLRHGWDGSSL